MLFGMKYEGADWPWIFSVPAQHKDLAELYHRGFAWAITLPDSDCQDFPVPEVSPNRHCAVKTDKGLCTNFTALGLDELEALGIYDRCIKWVELAD